MKINTTAITYNSFQSQSHFEYKAKQQEDSFSVTFTNSQTNKKVQLSINNEQIGELRNHFKDDMTFKDNNTVEVQGDLKDYLEIMWQKFKNEHNYKDSNGDGKLNPEEAIVAKDGFDSYELENGDKTSEVRFISTDEVIKKLSPQHYDKLIKKDIKRLENDFKDFNVTFNDQFLHLITYDSNFDTKITVGEVNDTIKQYNIPKTMSAHSSIFGTGNNLDAASMTIKAILEWIKNVEMANGIMDIGKSQNKEQVINPLQDMLNYTLDKKTTN